jgi:hypothetical protein
MAAISPTPAVPSLLYTLESASSNLHLTNLTTGEQSSIKLNEYTFGNMCYLYELLGGGLIATGGCSDNSEVVIIDTLREFEVCLKASMSVGRICHTAAYYAGYLYVVGGFNEDVLPLCERYVCAEDCWEDIAELPMAIYCATLVVEGNDLYALGGKLVLAAMISFRSSALKGLPGSIWS